MSEFLSSRYKTLSPYTPGEQPHGMKYIKLNTNESPFPPSKKAVMAAAEAAEGVQLYSDPECALLTEKMAKTLGLNRNQVLMTNGSDEILNFEVSGEKIQSVIMLPGYTHNIINLSDTEDLVTVMYCNEVFNPDKPDTYFDKVEK